MNTKIILKLAVYAGELMLRYGAETYRVEDTIKRICENGGVSTSESFVTPTGIFASVEDENGEIISIIKRIENRNIDLNKISLINEFSRQFEKKKIDFENGYKILKNIKSLNGYSIILRTICGGVGSAFFTLVFGGDIRDAFATLIIATIVQYFLLALGGYNISLLFTNILGGIIVSTMAILLTHLGLADNMDKVIIGAIMTMVPGVALTNAIRDTISGDLVSGASRAEEAIVIAIAIAAGVGSVLNLYFRFWR